MEAREGISSGVTVIGAEAPSEYHVAPRSEAPNPGHVTEGAAAAATAGAVAVSTVSVGLDGTAVKKKRGRPRKYGPDGSVAAMALSPLPISSSAPPSSNDFLTGKRRKLRGMKYKHSKKFGLDHLGDFNALADGTNFMPHIITVNAGEDITMKVISFSQQGPRAICILSANGVISNVTLRQPDSSGGTLTYEGRFEILSLSGSFMPTDNQGSRSRSGGMSVSLASPDGRVVGGGVAGLLVAASPVQVVVGSFLPSNLQDQKPKKAKSSDYASATVTPAIAVSSVPPPGPPQHPTPAFAVSSVPSPGPPQHPTNAEKEDVIGGGHVLHNASTLNSTFTPPSAAFRRENWFNMHSMQDSRKSTTDINISLPDS